MKKTKLLKGILFILMIALFIIIVPNTVNATVEYTRNMYSNNGSLKFNFTGLTLDTSHEYEFGLTKTTAATVETWHLITEYTETTATVDIMTTTKDLREVINAVDTGYITIKDKTEDEVILEPTAVDLKTPFLSLTNYTVIPNGKQLDASGANIQIALRCASNSKAYYQYEKITDTSIINKYKELKANSGDYLELQSMLKQTVPTSNWQTWGYWNGYDFFAGMNGYGYTQRTVSAPDEGLYYMWLYFSGEGIKNVYGYILVDNFQADTEAPTVNMIYVSSPATGTYKTPQTVKIHVKFSETIKGTTVPTLKIKFGDSEERNLTNGTIYNSGVVMGSYIAYTYNIQDSDIGQLETVSLTGGNITDEAGNAAKLSCPVIDGNHSIIKANVEATTTNNTENQDKTKTDTTSNQDKTTTKNTDKTTDSSSNASTSNNGATSKDSTKTTTSSNNSSSSSTTKTTTSTTSKDTTTMKGTIPQTGEAVGIFVAIAVVIIAVVFSYIKFIKYRDIK